jgi:hypothetical protein
MFYALVRHTAAASDDASGRDCSKRQRADIAFTSLVKILFEEHLAAEAKSTFGPIFNHEAMLRLDLEGRRPDHVSKLRDGRVFRWHREMDALDNALRWLMLLAGIGVAFIVPGPALTLAAIIGAFLLAASSAATWMLWFAGWIVPNAITRGRSWQPPDSILAAPIDLPDRTPPPKLPARY